MRSVEEWEQQALWPNDPWSSASSWLGTPSQGESTIKPLAALSVVKPSGAENIMPAKDDEGSPGQEQTVEQVHEPWSIKVSKRSMKRQRQRANKAQRCVEAEEKVRFGGTMKKTPAASERKMQEGCQEVTACRGSSGSNKIPEKMRSKGRKG